MLRLVLPKLDKWWFQHGHLRSLNLLLLAGLLTQATTGYDGSMLNGLQASPPSFRLALFSSHPDPPDGSSAKAVMAKPLRC